MYAEHPPWMDSAFFRRGVDPALWQELTSAAYKDKVEHDVATPAHRPALETAFANLKRLMDAGALVAFGTDSGANPYRVQGFAEHRELQLMVQAGLTPLQAIRCATQTNAATLHMLQRTGTLEAGKDADLLVLDGDPTTDIANTEKIRMVFRKDRQIRMSK